MSEQALTVLEAPQPGVRTPQEIEVLKQQARHLLDSGLLPKALDTPQKVFAIIQKGRELGLPPMYACTMISVINGKPTAMAELMQALVYRAFGDNALRVTVTNRDRCVVRFKRPDWPDESEIDFSMEDANLAGLVTKGGNYEKYPTRMLQCRAISMACRLGFPDVIGGLYTPEDLGGQLVIDDQGEAEIVEGVIVPEVRNALEAAEHPVDYADKRRTQPLPEDARQRADAVREQVNAEITASKEGERLTYESSSGNIRMDVPKPPTEGKPISQNAVATIVKLSKLTNRIVPDDIDQWTAAQGATRIQELSRVYNEQEQARRKGQRAEAAGTEIYETGTVEV